MQRNKKLTSIFGAIMLTGMICVAFATSNNLKSAFAPKIARANASVNCHCALLFGDDCSAANYGNTCSSNEDCSQGNENCE